MTIRDRGKIKWQGAFFMPEHVKMLGNARRDDLKVKKPILDDYQIEEFEEKIKLAIEFANQVNIIIWKDGFFEEFKGFIHRIDAIKRVIYLKQDDEIVRPLFFNDVCGVNEATD